MLAYSGQQVRWPFTINWADPDAEGLVACYVATPMGMVDLVNAIIGTRGGTEDPGRITEYGGMDAYFDGNGDSYAFGTDIFLAVGSPFTIVWESFSEQIGSGFDRYPCIGTFTRGTANQPFRIVYSDDGAYDDIVVGYTDVGGNADAWTLPTGITRTGMRHWGVWAYNGGTFSTDANHSMWVNGEACTNTGTPGGLANITDTTIIGKTNNLTTTDWYGGIRQVRLYTREWTQADAVRFASAAYRDSLFSPVSRPRRYFIPAASGAANLVIADATHAHSADSPSLTQDHQLAVQDAAHAHAADALDLTQQHVLAIDEASHAHAADSLTLTTEDALAIAEALHGHIADGVVLTQEHVLAVADALHEHTADEVTLDTATALQIADAVHEHLADNLGLTQAHVLAIAEALHAHRAGDVVLGVPSQDAGGGGPDAEVFDAPYRAYVKRVEAERLAEREARVAAREEAVEPVVAAPAVELEAVLPALVEPGVGLERMAGPAPAVASDAIALPAEAPEVQDLTAVREEARRARQEREMQLILTALLMAA
jgi:hypothetical protein